jgi:AcrR family transcriptional regulator
VFGKPGRPPEDRLERRRQIWEAVGPLIEKHGARGLTMRQAAAAAFISLGGLYHYFPSKRSLVLFGLDQEALEQACMEFMARYGHLKDSDPVAAMEAFIDYVVGRVFFVRPAVLAALELGAVDFMSHFEATVNRGLDGFIETLALALRDAQDRDLRLATALRLRHAALFDRSMTQRKLEEELRAVLAGVPIARTAALAAS